MIWVVLEFVRADYWRAGQVAGLFLLFIYVVMWKHKVKRLLGIRFGAWKRMSELYKRLLNK
jgi:hypothetical protein